MSAPVYHIFRLAVPARYRDEFEAVGRDNFHDSLIKDGGVEAMILGVNPSDDAYWIFEAYDSDEDYQRHRDSPQFKRFVQVMQGRYESRAAVDIEPAYGRCRPLMELDEKGCAGRRVNMARVLIRDEAAADFAQCVLPEMEASLDKEEGVLAMFASVERARPSADVPTSDEKATGNVPSGFQAWWFVEVYASDAAYEAHRATSHFRAYLEGSVDLVEEKSVQQLRATSVALRG